MWHHCRFVLLHLETDLYKGHNRLDITQFACKLAEQQFLARLCNVHFILCLHLINTC